MSENFTNAPASTNSTGVATTEHSGSQDPDQGRYVDLEPAHESPPGTPRWVKAFGVILVVFLLVFAVLHLTGNAPTHVPGSSGVQHGIGTTP